MGFELTTLAVIGTDHDHVLKHNLIKTCYLLWLLFLGNVFIDEEYMSQTGETVIDSHAEIIARRGFKRYITHL